MNWLDLCVFFLIASSAVGGMARGLLRELAGLFGLLLGLYVATRFHGALALAVDSERGGETWARTASFIVIAVVIWIAGELGGFFAARTLDLTGVRWLDRAVGAVFGALRGFVIAGIVLLLADRAFGASRLPVESSKLGRSAAATARVITGRVWKEFHGDDRLSVSEIREGNVNSPRSRGRHEINI